MSKITKKYFQGHFQESFNVFDQLTNTLSSIELSSSEGETLKQMLSIFFLGQLLGLPTLNSILIKLEIRSNSAQIKYKQLCKTLTVNNLRKIFEYIFESQLRSILEEKSQKDRSNWSRDLVTVVIDDSIFKQWIQQQDSYDSFQNCYGRFFSGQTHSVVYGIKSCLLGVSVSGVLYPLYWSFVKKKQAPDACSSTEVAIDLVKRFGQFRKSIKTNGVPLGDFHFSCDSGYNAVSLAESCKENGLIYISVPKKSHYIQIDDECMKLSDWISDVFEVAEKEDQEKQEKKLQNKEITSIVPFFKRFRATYRSQKQVVTFLAFRLKGSKKVTIIYSPDKTIFAKTLRRHFFQRTSIEQFFKLLKHVFKIQESRTTTKDDFEIKLLRFSFMAIHAQKLIGFIRKKCKEFSNKGFISLQRFLASGEYMIALLQEQCKLKY